MTPFFLSPKITHRERDERRERVFLRGVCVFITFGFYISVVNSSRLNVLKEGWDSDTKLSPHNFVCMW